jgi:hypothetical protein
MNDCFGEFALQQVTEGQRQLWAVPDREFPERAIHSGIGLSGTGQDSLISGWLRDSLSVVRGFGTKGGRSSNRGFASRSLVAAQHRDAGGPTCGPSAYW